MDGQAAEWYCRRRNVEQRGMKEQTMRHWAIAKWALGLVLAAAMVGCEKEQPPERTTEYDPAVDAPPTNLVIRPSRALLADQTKVAEEAAAQLAAVAERGKKPKAGPTDLKAIAVAAIVSKLIEAGKAGQTAALTPYFDPADGEEMKGMFAAKAEVPAAWSEMSGLCKEKKIADIPASVKQPMEMVPGSPPLIALADIVTDNLDYKLDGNSVVVTGGGTPLRLMPGPQNSWLIKMSPEDHAMYQAAGELFKAQAKFVKTLSGGLSDGSVTPENLDEKAKALTEEIVKPATEKLKEAIAAVKPFGPATQPTTAPTSAPAEGDGAKPATKPAAEPGDTPAEKPAAKPAAKTAPEDKDMPATPAAKPEEKDTGAAAGTGEEKEPPAAKPKPKTPPTPKAPAAKPAKGKPKPPPEE
jgi:hypothetical protein